MISMAADGGNLLTKLWELKGIRDFQILKDVQSEAIFCLLEYYKGGSIHYIPDYHSCKAGSYFST